MPSKKRLLVGLHNSSTLYAFTRCFKIDYDVDGVRTLEEMRQKAQTEQHDVYCMDLNLGCPNSLDISPAEEIFLLVQDRVEKGLAHFLGISGNDETVRLALAKGIPSLDSADPEVIETLHSFA